MKRLAIDIGGTFTDIVLEDNGLRTIGKVLTTPEAPEKGFMTGVQQVLEKARIAPADIDAVVHGTTLATNALIERKGAETVLVTTQGFRDSIEIAYEHRFEQSDLNMVRPDPLVDRPNRLEVTERIASDGSVLLPIDEDGARKLAAELAKRNVRSVAVGLLHSYANESHERRLGEILAEALPDATISLSCDVSPEIREYDRISTTVANAYVRPLMEGYLRRLEALMTEAGFNARFLMVTSSGGMCTLETACLYPIRLVESGPAGGAILARNIAAEISDPNVVSFDMGGTTAKICLVDNYQPLQSRTFEVARAYRFLRGSGIPLRIPVIEMVEIGAGGGSIADVDAMGRITVGPESASSAPGPACYGRGGNRPTVTDGDLVLSRLDPDRFAGGQFKLNTDAAREALSAHVGDKLELESTAAAAGVSEIVDENMSNAARVHAIEWGKELDARTMIAFGGAAPLHAARLAQKCGIKRVVIPTGAGVGSAIGFLRAPIAYDVTRSFYVNLDRFDVGAINSMLSRMQDEAERVVRLGDANGEIRITRNAFMRYRGQGHEIDIVLPDRPVVAGDKAVFEELFSKRYAELFGRTIPGLGHEVMTWRLTAEIPVDVPEKMPEVEDRGAARPLEMRDVFDPELTKAIPHGIYARKNLEPGQIVPGPAIIFEDETSTLINRHYDARVLSSGYLSLEWKE
jgi:N-methylhydantoinase A